MVSPKQGSSHSAIGIPGCIMLHVREKRSRGRWLGTGNPYFWLVPAKTHLPRGRRGTYTNGSHGARDEKAPVGLHYHPPALGSLFEPRGSFVCTSYAYPAFTRTRVYDVHYVRFLWECGQRGQVCIRKITLDAPLAPRPLFPRACFRRLSFSSPSCPPSLCAETLAKLASTGADRFPEVIAAGYRFPCVAIKSTWDRGRLDARHDAIRAGVAAESQ